MTKSMGITDICPKCGEKNDKQRDAKFRCSKCEFQAKTGKEARLCLKK